MYVYSYIYNIIITYICIYIIVTHKLNYIYVYNVNVTLLKSRGTILTNFERSIKLNLQSYFSWRVCTYWVHA